MISENITGKHSVEIETKDRIAQRLVYYALKNDDIDEIRHAFDHLYDLYHDHLYALALTRVDNKEDAEDVILDAFSEFYKAIMEGKEIGCLKAYLYTIFFWKCIDYNVANREFNVFYSLTPFASAHRNYAAFVAEMDLFDLLKKVLTKEEMYIFNHYNILGESLLEIKRNLKIKNKDIYKYYKRIIKKLKKGVRKYYD